MQTEKVLEKAKERKAKEKAKMMEKEKRANRKARKARNTQKEASNALGLRPGGRDPLVPHLMAQQTDLLANSF